MVQTLQAGGDHTHYTSYICIHEYRYRYIQIWVYTIHYIYSLSTYTRTQFIVCVCIYIYRESRCKLAMRKSEMALASLRLFNTLKLVDLGAAIGRIGS